MSVRAVVLLALVLCAAPAAAQITECDRYRDDAASRHKCLDEASGFNAREAERKRSSTSTAPPVISPTKERNEASHAEPRSGLLDTWSLDPRDKQGFFKADLHQPIYFIGRWSDHPNHSPASSDPIDDAARLDPAEAKFQLSFKARLGGTWGKEDQYAVWLGYTQQSHWQINNASSSRPFRESNYQPELIFTMRPDTYLDGHGGWYYRLFTLGALHESNGRSGDFSRSWNRLYAQFGFERTLLQPNDFAVIVRPWWRVPESSGDDNPDITDFLGHGDVTAVWRHCGHTLTLMGRGNVRTRKGAAQATWSFQPHPKSLRIYAQFFTGYGESLIDYDWRQTTFGVGVAVNDLLDQSSADRPCGKV